MGLLRHGIGRVSYCKLSYLYKWSKPKVEQLTRPIQIAVMPTPTATHKMGVAFYNTCMPICIPNKGILQTVLPHHFKSQTRTLMNKTRRPVPFGLANTLYGQLIGPSGQNQVDKKTGLSLLDSLSAAENPEQSLQTLSTSDIRACLYAFPNQVDSSSKMKGLVINLYKNNEKPERKRGPTDLNRLLQMELARRVKTDDLDTLFLCAHAVFRSRGHTMRYLTFFLDHILENFDELALSRPQCAKILFYIYYLGDAPEGLLHNLQEYLSINIDKFDINDIHVMSLGFFRANKRITDFQILENLAEKLLQNLENISGDALVSVMKIFRHSGFVKLNFFTDLAEKLTATNLRNVMSLNQIMHLGMVYGSLRLYNEGFLQSLVLRSKEILKRIPVAKIRSKDLGRLVWALGTFNYLDEEFLNGTVIPAITHSLNQSAAELYPESLMDVAMGMAYLDRYSDAIINAIFTPKTAIKLRDHPLLEKTNQLLYLHHSIKIEHPGYHGNILSQSFLDSLPRKVYGNMSRELSFRQGLATSLNTLKTLIGKEKVRCHFILPHFHTADLELQLDANGQPIKLDQWPGQPTELSDKCHTKIAIEVIGQNQCAVNSEMLLGNSVTKLRQLKKLGYVTYQITAAEATKLDAFDEPARQAYLMNILRSQLKVKI